MQRDAGEPDPVDEFERIVAGWRRERSVPAWPDDEPTDPGGPGRGAGPPVEPVPGSDRGAGSDGTGRDGTGRDGTGSDGTGRDGAGSDGTRQEDPRLHEPGTTQPDGPGFDAPVGDPTPPGHRAARSDRLWDGENAESAVHRPGPAADPDTEHFVPPEPPPLPPVGPPALVGLGLLLLGIVLITVPWWIGVPDVYGVPLGLITLAAGLGWLVLRLWPDPPTRGGGDGPDDGAVL